MKTQCKPPRHWIPKKNKCQTFKRHKSWKKWSDSITPGWARRACQETGMRSSHFLAEELRGTVEQIVEFLMFEPLTVKRIRDIFPYQKVESEYALDEREIQKAFPLVPIDVVRELHTCLEFCLVILIQEAGELANQQGLKSIQAKHISAVKRRYLTEEMYEKYE